MQKAIDEDEVRRLRQELVHELTRNVGVSQREATPRDWLQATSLAVRGRIVDRFHQMNAGPPASKGKQVCYLSMEFLVAKQLEGALMATGLRDACAEALSQFGTSLEDLIELESEPALGNGGLGRLAACFLESMACRGLRGMGYGLRYEYGMFRQEFADGWQVEQPDDWLNHRNAWELYRPEPTFVVGFGGHVEHRDYRAIWHPAERVVAVAHDLLVPGYRNGTVNTLRLWSARPVAALDFGTFSRGNYLEAVSAKIRSKTVTRLLYPDDSTPEGRELRLRQEHFFASASVQDLVARYLKEHSDWDHLPDKVAIHLNDTHPALAPAELVRLLVDEHRQPWDRALELTRAVFTYTNHTLMPEALEVWQTELMRRVAPRHLEIIEEINRQLLRSVASRSDVRADSIAVVSEEPAAVNMGRFSVVMSHKVNGVSALHSRLVRDSLFSEFNKLHPDRFCNVTNGISPRLWLFQSNPELCALIDRRLGEEWRETFDLSGLASLGEDPAFRDEFTAIKRANKLRLSKVVAARTGVEIDIDALIDVQAKRIHEYKRQLLNILAVIARWNAMKSDPHAYWPRRVVLIAGKAASSYWLAKLIIKLAHDVGRRINNDPETADRLKLHFLQNYNVSLAERLMPAADVSQQISLAGTEASGTGNMKLAMNGAITLCTRDGANIEIAAATGQDGIIPFGLTIEEVAGLQRDGYAPLSFVGNNECLRIVLEQIARGDFSPEDPHRFEPIVDSLINRGDRYMVLADFADYWRAQRAVDALWSDQETWTRQAINSVAHMGQFSADRAIDEYARDVWRCSTG